VKYTTQLSFLSTQAKSTLIFFGLITVFLYSCQKEITSENNIVTTIPTITTTLATSITATTAASGGNISSDGGATVTARGVCWSTTAGPDITGNHTTNGTGTGIFTSAITGLTASTVYYVRAYATNSEGTAYGNEISFTTTTNSTALATLTTTPITAITTTTASGGGNITADGGAPITARGVCWSTTTNPVVTGSHTTDGTGMGIFNSAITALAAGTIYYVRAYATNSAGTAYGNEVSFTTTAITGLPVITTAAITAITTKTAASGGNISSDGGFPVTARGVCWSTSTNPVASGNHTTNGTGTGIFTSNITGLAPSTTYYVRAYATNSAGTAYGNEITFTTLDHDIYIGGASMPGAHDIATIWMDGVPTELTDGTQEAYVTCIQVVGSDVYAGGIEHNGSFWVAKIWKNGVPTVLSDGTSNAELHSIYVVGSDVYAGGADHGVAKTWKNGVGTALPDGTFALSVFVSGSDLYACGDYYNYPANYALFWKNGMFADLTNRTTGSNANAVYVSGSDVYVGGRENMVAKIWKNGVATSLSNGTLFNMITTLYVNGTDVYAGGYEMLSPGGISIAKYWKNGVATNLSNGITSATTNSIFVFGTDVFVCGMNDGNITIWKNGVPTVSSVTPSATNVIYMH
jgi:hypothetical protein